MAERFEYVVVGLGALGSATCWELARRGHRVLGLERFPLGHVRGASHDTSRILRHSYHTPEYVALTVEAYADWARLSEQAGEPLVTVTGGLDLFPPDPAIGMADYTGSLDAVGIGYELLDRRTVEDRWPVFRLPPGTVGLFQERGAVVPAARGTRAMQEQARRHGAVLRDRTPVIELCETAHGIEVRTAGTTYVAARLVVCADAWTNEVLAGLGARIPLEVTLEQVTYFAPPDPGPFRRMPLWIWMDDPSFYGFPCYGEATVKAAQDCGGPPVDQDDRSFEESPELLARLAGHLRRMLPGSGDPVRSVRCLYTLTPDRDFVLDAVPGHPDVFVALGAAHGFKFAPTFGRLLADLATTGDAGVDVTPFRLDRPGLTDPAYVAHWLV
ncbi:MAG: N-methyl-L-tryptophan oxidase [Nocardioidaceae bacterium]